MSPTSSPDEVTCWRYASGLEGLTHSSIRPLDIRVRHSSDWCSNFDFKCEFLSAFKINFSRLTGLRCGCLFHFPPCMTATSECPDWATDRGEVLEAQIYCESALVEEGLLCYIVHVSALLPGHSWGVFVYCWWYHTIRLVLLSYPTYTTEILIHNKSRLVNHWGHGTPNPGESVRERKEGLTSSAFVDKSPSFFTHMWVHLHWFKSEDIAIPLCDVITPFGFYSFYFFM